jgi:hypothetical protein
MLEVDDEPMETLHIYVVREAAPTPSLLPIVLSVSAFFILVVVGVLSPAQQPVTRAVIRVPAVLLPLKTFTAKVAIIPTGVRVYPATTAHGTLTITNGSVVSQTLPEGLIFITKSGISVATNHAVFVPAGSADGYGFATVSAHAITVGKAGNIPAYAINQVAGSSIYIRNLTAFRGGREAYSVQFITPHDKQAALEHARQRLAVRSTGLHYPCSETISAILVVTWRCQFVTYHVPANMRVTGVRLQGKNLIVDVIFVARPIRIWAK